MEIEDLVPCSMHSATGPYPEPYFISLTFIVISFAYLIYMTAGPSGRTV